MPAPSDDDIDHLLTRGALGRPQKERILQHALASLPAPAAAARRRWWIFGGAGGLSLAAGLTVLAVWLQTPAGSSSGLRDKGGAAGVPIIDMWCLGGSASACPRGSRVAFSLDGVGAEAGFMTAYAEPIAGGERVWYLVDQPLGAPAADAVGPARVVPKAAVIGDEQPAGRYRVEVVVSRRPVGRAAAADLSGADVLARAQFQLGVSP